MRTCLAAASLALAALASAQEQPRVTLTSVATKTSVIAAEIKKQTGVQVTCNPTVADVPILLSVTDVPLDELLAKIAHVTGGVVVPQGENGFILTKSDRLRKSEADREFGWVVAAFERAKKKIAEQPVQGRWDKETLDGLVAKARAAREQMEQRMANVPRQPGAQITMFDSSMASSTPASGAARRALDLLPASVLASVRPGDRIVYSTLPNRMQQRMPINVQQIVADFVYNHNMLAQAAPQLRPQQGINVIGGLTAGEPIPGVAETHLVLSRGYRSTTVQVEIKFADRNGLYVGQGTTSVTPEYPVVQPATSEEGTPIQLSELSRQMAVLMAQELAAPSSDRMAYRVSTLERGGGGGAFVTVVSGNDAQPKIIPDELLNVLVNPDRYDPTSLYVSESFIQVAKAEGKDLVATFPDTVVRDLARILVKGEIKHKAVLAGAPALGLDVADQDGWMVVTPTWANTARDTRFDRDAAAGLFRTVHSRGFATLDEYAKYAFHVTLGLPDRPLDTVYLGLINKDAGDQFNEYVSVNLDLLRLYALIPENTKRQAGEELALPYRTLTPEGKRLADHAYYARPTGFVMPMGLGGGETKFTAAMMVMEENVDASGRPLPPANAVINEPTEALPNGIPVEALLRVSRTVQEGVFATTKGVRGGQMLTAQELGMRQGLLDANVGGGGTTIQFDTYQPAQIVFVNVTLDLEHFGRPSAHFKDGWLVNGSRPVAYNDLPEAFRQRVEREKQNMMRPPEVASPATGVRVRGGGG
jgi:hypothetical protein